MLDGVWREDHFSHTGHYYNVADNVLQPKPVDNRPRPLLYAGGESDSAKNLIAQTCDGYVMHGDPPAKIGERIADMKARREQAGLKPLLFGVAAYSVVRDTEEEAQAEIKRITDVQSSKAGYANYQQWLAGTKLEQQVSLEDYSVSNRGLRSGLTGTPAQIKQQIAEFEAVGVDFLLLQCSPQLEEMERFAAHVIGTPFSEAAAQ